MGRQGNRTCWRAWKTLQSWRNRILFYKEWDQGCICSMYITIPEKPTSPLQEDNGYKIIHKLSQFFKPLNSRNYCPIALIPMSIKNSDILSILYSTPLREYRKPKFKFGDRPRILRYDLFSGLVLSLNWNRKFLKLLQFLPGNLQPTEWKLNKMSVNFFRRRWCPLTMESITIELVWNASAQLFPGKTLSFFTSCLLEQMNLKNQWEVAISEIS